MTVEEGTIVNGFGAMLARRLQESHPDVRVLSLGVADELIGTSAARRTAGGRRASPSEAIASRVRAALPLNAVP